MPESVSSSNTPSAGARNAPAAQGACRTPLRPAVVHGTGLFTGKPATVVIRPGAPGATLGVSFCRTGGAPIPALADRVVADGRHTVLCNAGSPASTGVQTTEHLLAALVGLGIWSAEVELDGPEVPIMDGSAEPFVRALLAAGFVTRPGPRMPVRTITRTLVVEAGSARIEASPLPTGPSATGDEHFEAEYHLDYGNSGPLPRQSARVSIPPRLPGEEFVTSIAPARTFSLLAEALAARQAGLFAHVTPAEMLVIGDDGKPVDNRWRLADEPARHKLLDLVGDLALVGCPIVGRVVAHRSGHALNHAMARAIRDEFAPA